MQTADRLKNENLESGTALNKESLSGLQSDRANKPFADANRTLYDQIRATPDPMSETPGGAGRAFMPYLQKLTPYTGGVMGILAHALSSNQQQGIPVQPQADRVLDTIRQVENTLRANPAQAKELGQQYKLAGPGEGQPSWYSGLSNEIMRVEERLSDTKWFVPPYERESGYKLLHHLHYLKGLIDGAASGQPLPTYSPSGSPLGTQDTSRPTNWQRPQM